MTAVLTTRRPPVVMRKNGSPHDTRKALREFRVTNDGTTELKKRRRPRTSPKKDLPPGRRGQTYRTRSDLLSGCQSALTH